MWIPKIDSHHKTGGKVIVSFALSDNFIEKYKRKRAPFGFNGLGELII